MTANSTPNGLLRAWTPARQPVWRPALLRIGSGQPCTHHPKNQNSCGPLPQNSPSIVAPVSRPAVLRASRPSENSPDPEFPGCPAVCETNDLLAGYLSRGALPV